MHWGSTVQVWFSEFHDTQQPLFLFGEAAVYNCLMNGRTPNWSAALLITSSKIGFQLYDTSVKSILSNVTFRNMSNLAPFNDYAVRMMDHSDHYLPQGINGITNVRFEGVSDSTIFGIQNCGPACGTITPTMASSIYSIWDFDGSFSRTNKPTSTLRTAFFALPPPLAGDDCRSVCAVVGSNANWWHWNNDTCRFNTSMKVYTCDWSPNVSIGFVEIGITGLITATGCDTAMFGTNCTDQNAPYRVGRMTHWGPQSFRGINMSPWLGVAGATNTGWYWRSRALPYGIDGAPSAFVLGERFQIARGHFMVLAIRYPPTATFTVRIFSKSSNFYWPTIQQAPNLTTVLNSYETLNAASTFSCTGGNNSPCSNTGGVG